jgi:3-phosphoshikimate 1-carboxyvinyltransferase
MEKKIYPKYISGKLQLPFSKSYMQRACAAALLKGGITNIYNYGTSNDDKAALNVIQQLGATVTYNDGYIVIESSFNKLIQQNYINENKTLSLNLGESGLGLRMFTPIIALLKNEVVVTGHGSLTKRPMHFFDTILPQLSASIVSNNGYLPFTIKGPLHAKNISIDGSLSSQFLTGMLMAYSYLNEDAIITVHNLTSKPYIDITLDVLKNFGLNTPVNNNYKEFIFTKKELARNEILIFFGECDWSSASFMLVAAAINGNVRYEGLNINSVQGDKKILDALNSAGAKITIGLDNITVEKSNLKPFMFDATECPDLIPPLVALAANAKGTTQIKGLKRLEHKESNRGLTLQQEFKKLGVVINLNEDEMEIISNGNVTINEYNCESHNDHRIAMALTVAILNNDSPITINNAEAVGKSYPNFFEDLEKLQAS